MAYEGSHIDWEIIDEDLSQEDIQRAIDQGLGEMADAWHKSRLLLDD